MGASLWKRFALLPVAVALFTAFLRAGPAGAADDPYGIPGVDYVDGRVLVAFVPGTPAEAAAAAHAQARARVVGGLPSLGVQIVDVGPGRVPEAVRAYLRNPNVRFAEPDLIVRVAVDCTSGSGTFANDPCTWRQWGLDNDGQNWGGGSGSPDADVDVPEAWAAGARGSGVIIAVLDTGYDTTHEDVAGRVEASADFTGSGIEDRNGHGTWTASIAAAATDNGTGIAGVAPEARLIVGKVLGDDGSGSWSQVAAGITWAANYGNAAPKVISMSLGGTCTRGRLFLCSTLQAAVQDAAAKGALLVAAAGNAGKSSPEYPGAFVEVLAVAATDDHDAIAGFSSAGEIAAPGVSIFGAFPDCVGTTSFRLGSSGVDCGYDYASGTSAAAPIAAGAAALVWSRSPSSSADAVRNALTTSAQDVPGTAYDGAGRLTACGALASLGVSCSESSGGGGSGGGGGEPPAGYMVDLTGSASNQGRTWTATVAIAVTSGGAAAAGVEVAGSWSTGEAASCTTALDGTCTVSLVGISKRTTSVSFTVTSVDGSGDFGGETSVTVAKP